MDFNKFTTKSSESVQKAMELTVSRGHQEVTSLHLLMALLEQPGGVVPTLLGRMNVSAADIAGKIEKELSALPSVSGGAEQAYMSPDLKAVFDAAESEAGKLRDEYISAEHLFLAMLGQPKLKNIIGVSRDDALKVLAGCAAASG